MHCTERGVARTRRRLEPRALVAPSRRPRLEAADTLMIIHNTMTIMTIVMIHIIIIISSSSGSSSSSSSNSRSSSGSSSSSSTPMKDKRACKHVCGFLFQR